jgi:NMT1-like family
VTASFLLFYQADAAAQVPGGMVRYNHPVFHNGKRVLWHGVWRGRFSHESARAAPAKAAIAEKSAPPPQAPAAKPAPQSDPVKPFSILADADDFSASRMAKDFAEVLSSKGAAGRAIVGPTSPTGIAKAIRTDLADFAIVPFDTLAVGVKSAPDWPERVPIVARLAPETIEIIAAKDVKSIGDLQGKVVSFGDPDSATGVSARLLFSRLGVTVNPTYEPLTEALDALSTGKRGAVVVLGAKEAQALDGFGADGRYHVVAVPWAPELEDVYAPARVAAADRPNLVAANDSVETVAEPMALIALDAAPGSPRADGLGRTARIFFDDYDAFLSSERDDHWRDVNLAADPSVPTTAWRRLAGAQGWLDERKTSADDSLDAFRASAKTAADADGGPKADDSDRLYGDLTRWRGLMQ